MLARDFTVYKLSRALGVGSLNDLEAALSRLAYRPLASMERTGDGFAKPLPGYRDSYLLYVGRDEQDWVREFELGDSAGLAPQWNEGTFLFEGFSKHPSDALMMVFYREEKVIVKADIRRKVAEEVKRLEEDGMRKVYGKERRELMDVAVSKVLPNAQSNLWKAPVIFLSSGYVLIGAVGKKADQVACAVREVLGTFPIRPLQTKFTVPHVLTAIAKAQAKDNFDVFVLTDDFQMQGIHEHPPVARCKNTDITDDNIQGMLGDAKIITHAALCWSERVRFKTEPHGTLRKVKVDDAVLEGETLDEDAEGLEAASYASMMIEHSMFNHMLNDWLQLLGGEERPEGEPELEPMILGELGKKPETPAPEEEDE